MRVHAAAKWNKARLDNAARPSGALVSILAPTGWCWPTSNSRG